MFKKLQLLALALFLPICAFAQSGSISGKITKAKTGEPLVGATVFIQSLQKGASADIDGYYEIKNVPAGEYTLVARFLGFITQEFTVQVGNSSLVLDISLKEDILGLEELVVTGYSSIKKREVTGSITSVTSKDIEKVPLQNAAGLLQGRAAGVTVTSTSGTPGAGFSIRIRGTGSINAGTRPLFVVDGVQISYTNRSGTNSTSPLNSINPEDIESIEILKDAAASAIYGAQASNGVVLITTKKGVSRGTPTVTVSAKRGASNFIKNNTYFNRDQYIEFGLAALQYDNPGASEAAVENFYRANTLPSFGFDPSTPFNELPDTDWYDFNNRTGVNEEYRISISGGDDNSTYRIAGGLEDIDGYIKKNNYTNYNLSGRFTQQLSEKLSTDINIKMSSQAFEGPCQDGFYTNCPISAAGFTSPLSRPFLDNGDYSPYFLFGAGSNPAIIFGENSRATDVFQLLPSFSARYEFNSNISLRTQVSVDYRTDSDKIFSTPKGRPSTNGRVSQAEAKTTNFQTNTTLNYANTFQDVHNVSGLVGFEYRRDYTEQISATGDGLPNGLFNVLDLTATPTTAAGYNSEFRLAGYFTSLKYNYDEKYFLTFTGRYDGSSRFGADTKFGFFPSVSAGWTVSQEDFFNVDAISDFKLRASYGSTGNQSGIGNFASLGLYSASGSYSGVTALSPSQLANDQLSWESSTTLNLGADLSFFEGRIGANIDVYKKNNTDLLLAEPLPANSGYTGITKNIGEVENRGIEFQINSVNIQQRDFTWSTGFNIAYNENEIIALSDGVDALDPGDITPLQVGKSIRALKVIKWAGVNPADGRPMWYDINGNLTYTPTQNEDAVFINGGDQDVVGGLRNTFSYKGLTLNTFFQYSFGQNAQPQQVVAFGLNQVGGSGTNGLEQRLTEAWRKPGDIKQFPAPTNAFAYPGTEGYYIDSSDKFYNASYIRLKDITLSYSLPSTITNKMNMKNVQVFVSGLNLITWTSYIGYDPEVAGTFTAASIPVGKVINGGIEIQF
jgi:TonB-linked SusC/RagA family outer membrane protein